MGSEYEPDGLLEEIRANLWYSNGLRTKDQYQSAYERLAVAFIRLDEHLKEGGSLPAEWAEGRPVAKPDPPLSHREATRQLTEGYSSLHEAAKRARALMMSSSPTTTEKYLNGGDPERSRQAMEDTARQLGTHRDV